MSRRRPLLQYVLLLMLATGPLQARTVFLCEMMDIPRQETCCCEEAQATARDAGAVEEGNRTPCHATSRGAADGCCNSVTEVDYEPEAGAPLGKPPPDRQAPEPSTPTIVAHELPLPPEPPASIVIPDSLPPSVSDGSSLYLRTERLRI